MKKLNIPHPNLFTNLIEISQDGINVDIHNDYDCSKVIYDDLKESLQLDFESIKEHSLYSRVAVTFENVTIVKISLYLQNNQCDRLTLDTFYRGRFDYEGVLKEWLDDGRGYYYIGFDEDYEIELFSKAIKLVIYQ